MSTLRVDTIQNAAGTDSPINVPGTAKAWVNFNGTGTVAIRASYNVSSITDNGTGDYTVNFTTALADANYSFVATSNDGGGARYSFAAIYGGGLASGSARFLNYGDDGGFRDQAIVCCSIFR